MSRLTINVAVLAGAIALISACQSGATVPDSPPESATVPNPVVADETGADETEPADPATPTAITNDAPADADTIASLLGARHTEDLPDGPTLQAYATGEASLLWLASHGDSALTRTRAMSSLRYFDSAESRALLQSTLEEPSTHPTLQAAALTGLGGQDLSSDDVLFALLTDALASDDPRVTLAAVNTLANVERGRDALTSAMEDATLGDATLAQISDAIGPRLRIR